VHRLPPVENALYAFIGLGEADIIPTLIELLNASDDKATAEAYLNCGHKDLCAAATAWAERKGYTIESGRGAHPVDCGAL
jgi:hypothetical protein